MATRLILGNCIDELPKIESGIADAFITDPPYPEIDRPYGRLTEQEWWGLMMIVCREARRILKPSGSAVFILQPNSRKIGSMRPWLWKFMLWVCEEWNMIQDAWWWNIAIAPMGGANNRGLLRASLKACIWAGQPDCYRNQNEVLLSPSVATLGDKRIDRHELHYSPSGHGYRSSKMLTAFKNRGGVTPYNVLVVPNTNSNKHGASTPLDLAKWWVRYIAPPGGLVVDPFIGNGTVGVAALEYGRSIIGIEQQKNYFEIAKRRLESKTQIAIPGF